MTAKLKDLDQRTRELVAKAHAGNEVILTDNDQPVARITSIPKPAPGPISLDEILPAHDFGNAAPFPSRADLYDEMYDRRGE